MTSDKELMHNEQNVQVLDFKLEDLLSNILIFKFAKYFGYFLGSSRDDIEKQFLSNFTIVYQHKNIVFNRTEKKILVTNIDSFLNTKVLFAKSHFKILPGFLKFRDQLICSFSIYFKFVKIQEKYLLKNFLAFSF